jgi:hypothetical protein
VSYAAPHLIVPPGGGYGQHAAHEAKPIVEWLAGFGVAASVFRYPLMARHPAPVDALRAYIRRRREDGAGRLGVIGYSYPGANRPAVPGQSDASSMAPATVRAVRATEGS